MRTLAILLKESWAHVEENADDFANNFYARLFLADPDLRELLPVEMTAPRAALVSVLVRVIESVDDPERFDTHLRRLGLDHRHFHVEPHHFATVGNALLGALRQFAGSYWCVEYDQAWRDTYDAVVTKMLRGAEAGSGAPAVWPAEIVAHERRSRDIAVITCRPVYEFPFMPGQYAPVESPFHPRMWRNYSIANAPRRDGTIDLHVRAPSRGWVSCSLVRRLNEGDVVRLGAARGAMTLDRRSGRDIVAIAGGTGLAPIKALVEDLVRHNASRWVHVFIGARERRDLYDLPALADLASRVPWLTVVPVCSEDPTFLGERGNVGEVVERLGPWPDHDVYVCGSQPMVRSTLGGLARVGVPPQRIRYDAAVA
jgi:NAD(P)H-flavin reductase/hemoglobin-like flavoprotein